MTDRGSMDFDFRRRCVVKVLAGDIEYDRIYYGLSVQDYVDTMEDGGARLLRDSNYADLGIGGRRRPIEDEYPLRRHFFNRVVL